jgi:hypothetical protein
MTNRSLPSHRRATSQRTAARAAVQLQRLLAALRVPESRRGHVHITGEDAPATRLAQPNTTYQLSFWLAGYPLLAGTVSVAVQEQFDSSGTYITGQAIGTYNFDTTGHTADDMGYQLVTGSFTTGPNAAYVDVELQSATFVPSSPWWGPVVDQVTLK